MQNVRMYDWNDLRYFLAVARTGSTLAASRTLGVNQSTVARRIAVLERAVGMKLFDRSRAGYALTNCGSELSAAAERVEVEARAFADQARAIGRRVSGVIRVTTNEGLANGVMAPALTAFRRLHPEVRVDLVVDERRLDLARGAADVALRTGARPTEAGLIGRRLNPVAWAAYCSRDYAERHGRPTSVEALGQHAVVGADGPIAVLPGWTWLRRVAPDAEVVATSSSVTNLISAVKSGLGIAVLPCFLADSDPSLIRCFGPIEGAQSDLWLLTRENLRDVPRVRAFIDFLASHVASMRHVLSGTAASRQA
ncbi:LysR family transcriptional regulator [Sinorhizobium meliloti]|nr:LysR family transcriptional regulator [Sinorhizobium meliloti]RVH43717.1 LysR family transcriptional regulator [Sinorhizobium meliloti]RVI65196.1 LysR family transcriptional regulator [Sinorhizobium meliloti]RVK10354.1 LysR family transcriptional regulator [Sinorhizobium meliloti]